PLAVEDNAPVPVEYILQQNYPNPFNPSTTINYNLPTSGLVSLNVYDLLGREVASLVSTEQSAGQHSATWNGKNNSGNAVPSGVYLYSLSAGNYKSTMKMILMK
ncbi:MAG: T9SS type A sorting domain-containing protein, partial [Ignavibacteriaceae bacterium]|nr:T9SS type A sorting domain-containing protein [Ignavibacteriaceae bacterium]